MWNAGFLSNIMVRLSLVTIEPNELFADIYAEFAAGPHGARGHDAGHQWRCRPAIGGHVCKHQPRLSNDSHGSGGNGQRVHLGHPPLAGAVVQEARF